MDAETRENILSKNFNFDEAKAHPSELDWWYAKGMTDALDQLKATGAVETLRRVWTEGILAGDIRAEVTNSLAKLNALLGES